MEHQEQAFNKLKQLVTEAPILKYFEPKVELTLQSCASDTGLGEQFSLRMDSQSHLSAEPCLILRQGMPK